jgi:hypothetical protein
MGIEFLADEEGRAILAVRGGRHTRKLQRKSLLWVNAAELDKFAKTYELNERQKALVAMRLNNIRSMYNLTGLVDTHPADTAVARWIGDLDQSISRIAGAVTTNPKKWREALDAMERAASQWARTKDDATLQELGFVVHRAPGYVNHGTHEFIRNWFKHAGLIKTFATEAQENLTKRNWPHGLKGVRGNLGGPGKETWLYGVWLPFLYMRMTKTPFGISKDSTGPEDQRCRVRYRRGGSNRAGAKPCQCG